MNEAQLIKTIRVHIAAGDKAAQKSNDHYVAAGLHLKTPKENHGGSWAEWEALLRDKIGIGKSRASELMQIADGRKTVEQVRADTAKRTSDTKTRLKLSATRGESKVKPKPTTANADDPDASAEERKAEYAAQEDADEHGAALGATAASPPRPLIAASESSWRVELTTDDGKRWVNGARLKTKEEAALYAIRQAEDKLSPLWRRALRKEGYKPQIVMTTRVLGSADAANVYMSFPRGRLGEANIHSRHGECHLLLKWHPEGGAEPSCPDSPDTATEAPTPAATEPALIPPADDGVPGFLRRNPDNSRPKVMAP
jgi:hypothetical protein